MGGAEHRPGRGHVELNAVGDDRPLRGRLRRGSGGRVAPGQERTQNKERGRGHRKTTHHVITTLDVADWFAAAPRRRCDEDSGLIRLRRQPDLCAFRLGPAFELLLVGPRVFLAVFPALRMRMLLRVHHLVEDALSLVSPLVRLGLAHRDRIFTFGALPGMSPPVVVIRSHSENIVLQWVLFPSDGTQKRRAQVRRL